MNMPSFARVLAGLAMVTSILAMGDDAHAWAGLEGPPFPYWGTVPVKYYINKASFPAGIAAVAEERLASGFASWSAPNCTYFDTLLVGDLPGGTFNTNDGKNILLWIGKPNSWPSELGPEDSVIGVSLPIWGDDGQGHLLLEDADIIFNDVGFCWYDFDPAKPDVTCTGGKPVDTLSIVTHEQGHFLGLGHTNVAEATMEPAYLGGNKLATLEQDDIDGVCALYPLGGMNGSSSSGAMNCDVCTQNKCLTWAKACTSSCVGLGECVHKCPKNNVAAYETCATKCSMQFNDGIMAYTDYTNCLCTLCAEPCAAECKGPSDTGDCDSGNGGQGGGCPTPEYVGTGGCGCSVVQGNEHIGFLSVLGVFLGARWRQRRRR